MASISLEWKAFAVNLDKVNARLKVLLSSNYDGLLCDEDSLNVMFKDEVSEADTTAVSSYWAAAAAPDFAPTLQEILTVKISDAMNFGNGMIVQASVENITMGITQVGKTKIVLDYLNNVQTYLKAGSLYAAIEEINNLLQADIPSELAPFVTGSRLTSYKHQIQTYLGIPQS